MTEKVAIVTGGTRGIGLEITRHLVKEGYSVVALYQGNEEAAQNCAQETGARTRRVDVTDFDACERACRAIEKEIGPVSVLVNNAGITRDGVLHKMAKENWDSVIAANLTSAFNMCRAVVAGMRERGFGRIINIGSINGQKGQFGQTNYAAAKAGMIGFTKALALESAAKNITVNIICPGYIATEMTEAMDPAILDKIIAEIPAGRMGQATEIAEAVCYLASDKAGFINGSTLSINGGQLMA